LLYFISFYRFVPFEPRLFYHLNAFDRLFVIPETTLAEAAEHAFQELADNPKHQQYNYNLSHSFTFI